MQLQQFSAKHTQVQALAAQQLEQSGLTLQDAAANGLEILSSEEMQALGYGSDQPGLLFKYWDPWRQAYIPPKTFHRVRLLGHSSNALVARQVNPTRYLQPPNTLNSLYLPRQIDGVDFDWGQFLSGDKDLYITEGEKKALLACKRGLPCIALGGVDMWRASKRGIEELPMLRQINFAGRSVLIIFDTDTANGLKPTVLQAANRLMDYLAVQGAVPQLVILPPREDGVKVALDDYLMQNSVDDLLDVVIPQNAVQHAAAVLLTKHSQRYVYLKSIGKFLPIDYTEGSSDNPISRDRLDEILGMRRVSMPVLQSVRVPGGGGTVVRPVQTPTPVASALLMFGGLTKARGITYSPGQPKLVHLPRGGYNYNIWEGWRAEYENGRNELPPEKERNKVMALWNWALDNLFGDDGTTRNFVENWIFYPIKYPGTKLNTLVLLISPQQGIGKTFIADMLATYVYGLLGSDGPRHAAKLVEGALDEAFNSFLYGSSFVLGDDIATQHRSGVYKRLMSYVTSETVQINIKNVPQFAIENKANFWLTSNEASPFTLSDQDRRAVVHQPRRAKKDPNRYNELKRLFVAGIGGPTLLWYAREQYAEGTFNPLFEAPYSVSKQEMTMNAKGALRDWLEGLIACAVAGELSRPIATAREVMALMELDDSRLAQKVNDRWIGQVLADCGAFYHAGGRQAAIKDNISGVVRRERVWILGDPLRMTKMSTAEVGNYVSSLPLRRIPLKGEPQGQVVKLKGRKF